MSENQHIIDEPSERTIRTRTVKYSGYVIETAVEEYELNEDTVLTRDVVEMPGAVAVAVLNERNELLMLNQYRHPVRMNLWEVPAGLLDIDGEDPLHAAQRELAEETDLRAASWHALTDYFSSPGATSEAGRVYLARDLSELPRQERTERTEEEAEMTYRWVPLQDAVQLVLDGKVHNALAIQAILATYAASARGFEGLREAAGGWEFHPYMGHRRQKPQTFR
ncbi:NUDIX hydrolase [Rothia mucilaginosa]|uniref:NUDIX domain-containing protein n=1 Tax=Rothia mucilaginosa TaxID=43675 RepID=UPI000A6B43AF